jgi:UPF0716 protein FxsA
MNVAKWVLLAVLAVPFLELTAFIAVATMVGFGWALGLVLAGSLSGALILHHAGGSHIARMQVVLKDGNLTALQADSSGGRILLAGILLLIPGFITDVVALCLLIPPLGRGLGAVFGLAAAPAHNDGVVDLPPEQWHQVPDPSLPDRGRDERAH